MRARIPEGEQGEWLIQKARIEGYSLALAVSGGGLRDGMVRGVGGHAIGLGWRLEGM